MRSRGIEKRRKRVLASMMQRVKFMGIEEIGT